MGGVFWFLAAVGLVVEWLAGDGTTYDLILYLFLIGLVPWIIGMRLKSTRYFVFNRTAGTVLFPAKWRCPPLILRFEDVRCHPDIYVLQFGGVHRTNYLWANKVTKNAV